MDIRKIIVERVYKQINTDIDPQVNKMYRAERHAYDSFRGRKGWIPSRERVADVIHDKLVWHPKLTELYGDAANIHIDVKTPKHSENKDAYGYTDHISLPGWTFRSHNAYGRRLLCSGLPTIAHEVAHTIHQRLSDPAYSPDKGTHSKLHAGGTYHGPQFAAVYLNVVHAMMGQGPHDALKASFGRHGVNYRIPREHLNQAA